MNAREIERLAAQEASSRRAESKSRFQHLDAMSLDQLMRHMESKRELHAAFQSTPYTLPKLSMPERPPRRPTIQRGDGAMHVTFESMRAEHPGPRIGIAQERASRDAETIAKSKEEARLRAERQRERDIEKVAQGTFGAGRCIIRVKD